MGEFKAAAAKYRGKLLFIFMEVEKFSKYDTGLSCNVFHSL